MVRPDWPKRQVNPQVLLKNAHFKRDFYTSHILYVLWNDGWSGHRDHLQITKLKMLIEAWISAEICWSSSNIVKMIPICVCFQVVFTSSVFVTMTISGTAAIVMVSCKPLMFIHERSSVADPIGWELAMWPYLKDKDTGDTYFDVCFECEM